MKLVLLFGDCAVGKMTVGQELAKITDLRLFHNHMTIEPVLEIFGTYEPAVIEKLRQSVSTTELLCRNNITILPVTHPRNSNRPFSSV